MATRISFFKRPGDYQNNYRDETIYFKDVKAREILDGKQIKLKAGRGLKLNGNVLSIIPQKSGAVDLNQYSFIAQFGNNQVQYTVIGNPRIYKEASDDKKINFLNNAFITHGYNHYDEFNSSDLELDSSSPAPDYSNVPEVPKDAIEMDIKLCDLEDNDSFDFFAIYITDISEVQTGETGNSELVSVYSNECGVVSYIQDYEYDSYSVKQEDKSNTYAIEHNGFFQAFFKNL